MHRRKIQFALALLPITTFACSSADSEPTSSTESASTTETAQYGFETGTQGWQSSAGIASVYQTSATAFGGTHALAVAFSGGGGTVNAQVANPQVPAGSKVTFHVKCPAGAPIDWIQPYVLQSGNWTWTGNWQSTSSLVAGGWNALTVTVPSNAAPLAQLGVQFHNKGGATTCDVDSVGWGSGVVTTDAGAPAPDSGTKAADSGTTTADSGTTTTPKKWVSGYYVGYQQDMYPPSAIDFTALTHVVVGAVVPQTNGTLDTSFSTHDGLTMAKTVSGLAHAAGKKAILMIGGAGAHDGFASSATSTYRATFVANLKSLVQELGYDGLDLDWEPLNTSEHPDFTSLVHDLRAAMPGIILTMPLGWGPTTDTFWSQIAPSLDQMNLMSYGMADAWPGWQSWHSSALTGDGPAYPSSIDRAVKVYTGNGVPISKIGMGIGFYGECWAPGVNGPRENVNGSYVSASDNTMSYTNIMTQYFTSSARQWDSTAQVPFLSFAQATGPAKCTFVSYDDAQSIAAKGQYAKQTGLGGTIIWTIGQGYMPNATQKNPLLDAVKAGFLQ